MLNFVLILNSVIPRTMLHVLVTECMQRYGEQVSSPTSSSNPLHQQDIETCISRLMIYGMAFVRGRGKGQLYSIICDIDTGCIKSTVAV
jgi:hypothetical protein